MNLETNATLAALEVGATAKIIGVNGESAAARRLLEMGVVPGASVRIIKSAPFGDPLEVRVRNSHLAIRKSEANTIFVE